MNTIDWPVRRKSRRPVRLALIVGAVAFLLGGGTALSYYVESLWFDSLGLSAVFWKTLNFQGTVMTFSTSTSPRFPSSWASRRSSCG